MAHLTIAAGGTGGHVYPALAVAEAIYRDNPHHQLTFIGTRGGGGFEKKLVEAANLPFVAYTEVLAGPIVGINPLKASTNALKMGLGALQAVRFLRQQRPHAILLTGGWANVPVAIAGRLLAIPLLVYLPDIEPGRTIQFIARFAHTIALTVPDSARYFPQKRTITTGYPLRQNLLQAQPDYETLHLNPDLLTLLITGGSRGARSINSALETILPDLLADSMQIIHITGTLDWERSQANTHTLRDTHPQAHHYHPMPYSHDMGQLLAAADAVIARAGASVLGELTHFGIPSILVPYPHAWRYQRTNADYLAQKGAAYHLSDEDMPTKLLPTIRKLLQDKAQYKQMRQAAKSLAVTDGAGHIARELLQLGVERNDG